MLYVYHHSQTKKWKHRWLVECFRKEDQVKTRIVKTIGQSKTLKLLNTIKKTALKLLDEHKKGLL